MRGTKVVTVHLQGSLLLGSWFLSIISLRSPVQLALEQKEKFKKRREAHHAFPKTTTFPANEFQTCQRGGALNFGWHLTLVTFAYTTNFFLSSGLISAAAFKCYQGTDYNCF